ncbi:hydrogenase nickel incorporation protein HypB [Helicobacter sp. 11S03491-1]|uniref:hydrogenase nickel incorporation protein HypB n=1 Tax=Helicobacter sp. 11S03491-1 TaxID=1476196 RepID=UPI000BA57F6D|nr:hydrogenase nickel incorporation protein HypB [Helicobacter sp. 11S03491-1]PAF43705.1 hydrogenase accessory protein HypB [Helicobacter sp. 11S03491-1]
MNTRAASLNNNPNLNKKSVQIVEKILSKNDIKANSLRQKYKDDGLYTINLMSSPGSGKTTLLESLSMFDDFKFCVVEGDLQTNRDADRLIKKGIHAQQIATGEACHLEASMVETAYEKLQAQGATEDVDYLVIENVGNLVCPASYDLGAALNIVLLSVPEGDDKVLKYPTMFLCADAVVISKSDMIDYFGFRVSQVKEDMAKLKPNVPLFLTSTKDTKSLEIFKDFIVKNKQQEYYSKYSF